MRWLFVILLVCLVGCVLSLVWLNDTSRWPLGDSRIQPGTAQPSDPNAIPAPSQ
jgi:hypothetical protein